MTLLPLPNLNAMIDAISEQKKLPPEVVEEALEEALVKGYERYRRTQALGDAFDEDYFLNVGVELDLEEEGFRVLASKNIVEEVEIADHQISLTEVQEVAPEAQLGDTVVLDVTPEKDDFGRMAAIQTKQVLSQKLRDYQRMMIQEEFKDVEDPVLNAKVLRFERQSVIMEVSSGVGRPPVEAELPRRDQLPNDNYRANATFRVFLKEVAETPRRGPQIIVSRTNAGLVVYMFENEVPEIQDEIVRIVAVAREANPPGRYVGPRTKIAVDTLERDVDPVGACIGARGSRIQAVVNELHGEKIDVIRWSPDPATYIANALSPARVEMVRLVDPEARQAHVLVPEDQLSLAIGKEGQNVRLAARLTGWKIDIKDIAKYDFDEYVIPMIMEEDEPQEEPDEPLAEDNLGAEEEALEEVSEAVAEEVLAGDSADSDPEEVSAEDASEVVEANDAEAVEEVPEDDVAIEAVEEVAEEAEGEAIAVAVDSAEAEASVEEGTEEE